MSLSYSKEAVIKGFAGSNQLVQAARFDNDVIATPEQRMDQIFTKSNECRWWYEPIFANETKYLPASNPANSPETVVITASAPLPPQRVEEDILVKALLVGAGIFVLYKLLA